MVLKYRLCFFLMAISPLYAVSEKVIFSFNGADGQSPYGLTPGPPGTFYGVTNLGGAGFGTVYQLTYSSTSGWVQTVIYTFSAGDPAGVFPAGPVTWDPATGVVYGLNSSGGANLFGTAYALSPISGGSWTISAYSFSSAGGTSPYGGLYLGPNGNLAGATLFGGTSNHGEVFELVPPAHGGWTEVPLYSFAGGTDGTSGAGTLVSFGTTLYGVTYELGGTIGTAYSLHFSNGVWVHTVLHIFTGSGGDGQQPTGLVVDTQGNLYGTTYGGGAFCFCGIVFELSPPSSSGGAWTESILFTFHPGMDGIVPAAPPSLLPDGSLVGTTTGGGLYGRGVVYHLKQTNGTWSEKAIYSFAGGLDDGVDPQSPLVGVSGVLYSTTLEGGSGSCPQPILHGCGTIFTITP